MILALKKPRYDLIGVSKLEKFKKNRYE